MASSNEKLISTGDNKFKITENVFECSIDLNVKVHKEMLYLKKHTIHCIIHKHLGYFANCYNINNLKKFALRYGCEYESDPNNDWEQLDKSDYKSIFEKRCNYFNRNYVHFEERAKQEFAIIKMYSDKD
jgi:hypothetical protein